MYFLSYVEIKTIIIINKWKKKSKQNKTAARIVTQTGNFNTPRSG